jgi:hypothetical protein
MALTNIYITHQFTLLIIMKYIYIIGRSVNNLLKLRELKEKHS